MSDIINLADRRNPGIDLQLFELVAAELELGAGILADFRPRLALLDGEVRRGCEFSKRYWRLLRQTLVDAIPVVDREGSIDSLTLIASLLAHWHMRFDFEKKTRANAG